jgi:hypothetical protein
MQASSSLYHLIGWVSQFNILNRSLLLPMFFFLKVVQELPLKMRIFQFARRSFYKIPVTVGFFFLLAQILM